MIRREPLKDARRTAGLTAVRCAELAGTTEPRLYQLERQRFRPRREEAHRLSEVLNVPVKMLFPNGIQEW